MLTLRQYLNTFVRKEHTIELRRLVHETGRTREYLYRLAEGAAASLTTALRLYKASHGRIDPRGLAWTTDWEALDAYYLAEHAKQAPAPMPAAVARAGRSKLAGQARAGLQCAGRGQGPAGTAATQRAKPAKR